MVQKTVKKWAGYSRLGGLSPHDLWRTVTRYGRGRENLEQNAVNFPRYEEEG